MSLDFPQASVLLLTPLGRHPVEERSVNTAVELVEIHCVDAVADPFVFGLKPLDCLLMLVPFVNMACVQRFPYPFEHFVVELELAQQIGKLLFQYLFTDIAGDGRSGIVSAFIGISRTVVIDVFLLLNVADDGATAAATSDQT